MSVFKLFPTQKPKKFTYNPIFYDERKERLQKMIEEAERESAGSSSEGSGARLEHGFIRQNLRKSKYRKNRDRTSSLRIWISMILLLFLFYLLLYWF